MRVTLNLHYAVTRNVGDLCSLPMFYFSLPKPVQPWDIKNAWPARRDVNLLFGGGGVDSSPPVERAVKAIAKHPGRRIVWGGGTHLGKGVFSSAGALASFELAGIRDWVPEYKGASWVPCASCMSGLFDRPCRIEHEVVVFEQEHLPLFLVGLPTMRTCIPKTPTGRRPDIPPPESAEVWDFFGRCVAFLSSGETVITTSYHGAYWATLLGRKVVVVPPSWSDKFRFMRHPVVLSDKAGCLAARTAARSYPQALDECRASNRIFSESVIELLSEKGTGEWC